MLIGAFVAAIIGVGVVIGDDGCKTVASKTAYLTPDTFGHDVAHGIHSITVEDIDTFFGVDVFGIDNNNNGIPTANSNISDIENPVLDNAPFVGYEKRFSSPALKAMDYLMRSNGPDLLMNGANVIEKLGHSLHMQEMWMHTAKVMKSLKKEEIPDEVCDCVANTDINGVKPWLKRIFTSLRQMKGKGQNGDFVYDLKTWEAEKSPTTEKPVGGGFNYNLEYAKKAEGQGKDSSKDLESSEERPGMPYKLKKTVEGGFNYNLNYRKKDNGQVHDSNNSSDSSEERSGNDYDFKSWKADYEGGNVKGLDYKFEHYRTKDPKSKNNFKSWEMSGNADDDDNDSDIDNNVDDVNGDDDQSNIVNRFIRNFFKPSLTRSKREGYLAVGSFAYGFDKRRAKNLPQGFEHQNEETDDEDPPKAAEYHWAPGSVVGPGSWADYREMLIDSMPSKKATKNLALFMFCKLRNFA